MNSSSVGSQQLQALVGPVVANTYWIKNAIGLYEGISQHAEALNAHHGHFFGMTQKISLDFIVIGICRMFDTSNQRYRKHTVPELMHHFEHNFTDAYIQRLSPQYLTSLRVTTEKANLIVGACQSDFKKGRGHLLQVIQDVVPTVERTPALRKLFLCRDKIVAHQEQLTTALREALAYLPPVEDMEGLNKWAGDFCRLLYCLMTPDVVFVDSVVSARMAALNVAAKVLGKTFDDPSKTAGGNFQEWEAFFKRPAS